MQVKINSWRSALSAPNAAIISASVKAFMVSVPLPAERALLVPPLPFRRPRVCVAQVACARAQPARLLLDAEVLDVTDVTATQGVDCFSYHYQGAIAGVACLIHSFLGFGFGSPGDLLGHPGLRPVSRANKASVSFCCVLRWRRIRGIRWRLRSPTALFPVIGR